MKSSILIGLLLLALSVTGQTREEIIRKEYNFEKAAATNVFQLANITGPIEVVTHKANNIILEATKNITGETSERVELGMQEVGLSLLDRYDTLIVYAANPCHSFKKRDNKIGYAYAWGDCVLKYDYAFDMKLYVPAGTNLVLSTVNDGNIKVTGVSGNLAVRNVNGDIVLEGVQGKVEAHTINGDVEINYAANPKMDSRYYTLNGDITANFKPGLAAKISFKSFNGDMYTNLSSLNSLPGQLVMEKTEQNNGVKYKVNDRKYMQARDGKILLDFETFNGDAYIKEK